MVQVPVGASYEPWLMLPTVAPAGTPVSVTWAAGAVSGPLFTAAMV